MTEKQRKMLNLAFGDGASDGEIVNVIKMLKPAYKSGELFGKETTSNRQDNSLSLKEALRLVDFWKERFRKTDFEMTGLKIELDYLKSKYESVRHEHRIMKTDLAHVRYDLAKKQDELNHAKELYEREIKKLKYELGSKVDTYIAVLALFVGMFIMSLIK